MQATDSLRALQIDALCETANIGAGHAATALSQMTGSKIMIQVPSIAVTSLAEIPRFDADEEPVAAVMMQMLGDLTGRTLLIFPRPTVMRMAEMMLHRPLESTIALGELEQSAIKEAGNILSGAYMNALSDFLGVLLLPSPPTLVIDKSSAVLSNALASPHVDPGTIICVESEFIFIDTAQHVRGFFLLLPDPPSLQVMMRALRLA
jgi:chemotaxis protein CheC